MTPEVEKAYETLRLPTGASPDEVKKEWRNLTMAFHPDRFDGAERKAWATEQQKEINAAYEILCRFQRTQNQAPPPQPPRQPRPSASPSHSPPPAPPQSSASRSEEPEISDSSGTVQPGRGRMTGGGLAAVVYWSAVACVWCWCLVLSIRYNNQQEATAAMGRSLSGLWSPTGDPVLNFLIDVVLLVTGLVLVPGVIAGGLSMIAVLIGATIVIAAVQGLVALAGVSATGAIVVTATVLAIVYFGGRALVRGGRVRLP